MSKNNKKHSNISEPENASEGVGIEDNVIEMADETVAAEQEQEIEAEANEIDELNKKLDETNAALEKEKKEYLFLLAEFDNFRKRTVKEKGDIIKNAAEKVLGGLLPIVDDFERGIEANKNADDAESVKKGMELIYNKLVKFLETNGVKPIESTGKDFDPELHEAIAMVPAPDETQKGKVIDTPTRGYTINDKVLRHAKVVVAQ